MPTDFNLKQYGPNWVALLKSGELNPLDAGEVDQSKSDELQYADLDALFAPQHIVNRDFAQACVAGGFLRFNDLHRSHEISQSLETPDGSFWHGVMHRREHDFWNAKYWFRRVGSHPIDAALAADASRLAADTPAAGAWRRLNAWDPMAFVDLCEAAQSKQPQLAALCQQIQRREWELLFDYCFRQAVGE